MPAVPPQFAGNAEDLECVRRIAAGNAESVGDLYDRHATAMYSLALRILDREADAQDVVPDVFALVWREAGRNEASRGIVGTWLLMLTRHLAIERLGVLRAELHSQHTDGEASDLPAPVTNDPANAIREFDACERVRRALHALPVLHRGAIEMTYFEGLSQQEVARRLEQPVATIRTRIGAALLKLRTTLTWEGR
jgi:RNA polymerase sigma-70 factor (ECF subfamily)